MTIKWNLPNIMYERGVFSPSELKRLLKEKGNLDITAPAIHRLVNQLPHEVKFSTINALCMALDCELHDIIQYEKPTITNQCIQPLILESNFKPPKRAKKNTKSKIKIDLPPI